jgi:hypothetical protein
VWSAQTRTLTETAGLTPEQQTALTQTHDGVAALQDAVATKPALADIQAATLNANITHVNSVAVTGTGAKGSEWGPSA